MEKFCSLFYVGVPLYLPTHGKPTTSYYTILVPFILGTLCCSEKNNREDIYLYILNSKGLTWTTFIHIKTNRLNKIPKYSESAIC